MGDGAPGESRGVPEIADCMNLSVGTVRDYLKRIYDKLHVHSRTQAALLFKAAAGTSPV